MPSVFEVLAQIAVWVLFISGLIMILGPTLMGIATKALVGTVNSVDDGKILFYKHGIGYLIGAVFLAVAAYTLSVIY